MGARVPFVTIAIPCLDEASYIAATVRGALTQDYPAERIEVLVADGGSRDGTREILARLAHEQRVRLLDNPQRIQAAAMNAMIRAARGDVIVRMDVHAEYARDYVRRAVEVLERTGADNAGGAQRPRAESPFQQALCAALSSPLGVGGAAYRSPDAEGWVDTVFCGAFRRRAFERAGLYDPGAVTNEDAELNQRIADAGGGVYLSRDIVAHYYPRDSLPALARQYFRYGVGRARTLLKHRGLPTIRPLLPFLCVVGGATLAIAQSPALWPCLGLYILMTGVEARRVGSHLGFGALLVWLIFPVLHLSHGIGFGAGLARYLSRPDWQAPERLAPRREAKAAFP